MTDNSGGDSKNWLDDMNAFGQARARGRGLTEDNIEQAVREVRHERQKRQAPELENGNES